MSLSNLFDSGKGTTRRKNIFISYRERDSAGETGRLVDALKQFFYEDQIFMDIDKIEPGVDFTEIISKSLDSCDVMLAVIGNEWVGKNPDTGALRIKDDNDWVRLEIATALKRNIRVVPILVDGASLPSSIDLPDDLQALVRRQAYELSNKRWRYDTENLAAFLETLGKPKNQLGQQVKTTKSSPLGSVVKYGLIGVGALFVILVIIELMKGGSSTQNEPTKKTAIDNRPHDEGNEPVQPSNDNSGDRQKPASQSNNNTATESVDIDGVWDDANGLYYLDIFQTGNQVDVVSYSVVGQKTGEGTGKINGGDFSFRINIVNFGMISAQAKVSSNGYVINGSTIVERNGAEYKEPLTLRKRN